MARSARQPPAHQSVACIGTCQAEFDVFALRGPLSAPETLLTTVRQELLPVLSDVLDAPEWQEISVTAPLIEIDLGDWPDDPDWADVRRVLSLKLWQALQAHISPQRRFYPDAATSTSVRGDEQDSLNNPLNIAPFANAAGPLGSGADTVIKNDSNSDHKLNGLAPGAVFTTQNDVTRSGADSAQDPSKLHDSLDLDPRRLENAGIAAALDSFFAWLETSITTPSRADILAHIAERAALQQALAIWQGANPEAQRNALPLTPPQLARIRPLALRLRAEAERSHVSSEPKSRLEDIASLEKRATDAKQASLDIGADGHDAVSPTDLSAHETAQMLDRAVSGSGLRTAEVHRVVALLATALVKEGLSDAPAQQQSQRLIARLAASNLLGTTPQEPRSKDAQRQTVDETVHKSVAVRGNKTKTSSQSNDGVESRLSGSKDLSDLQGSRQGETSALENQAEVGIAHSRAEDRRIGHDVNEGQDADLPKDVSLPGSQKSALPMGANSKGTAPRVESSMASSEQSTPENQGPLLKLAVLLRIKGAHQATLPDALRRILAHRFAERPRATFEFARTTPKLLQPLVVLLRVPNTAEPVLLGDRALAPPQIREMHAAHPHVLHEVVREMTAADAAKLASRLVPQGADLLRSQVAALQRSLLHPRAALQNVALALLDERTVDFEAMRGVQSSNVTVSEEMAQPPTSGVADRSAVNPSQMPDTIAPTDKGIEPDLVVVSDETLERLADTLGRPANALDTLLLHAGLSTGEVARVAGTQDAAFGKSGIGSPTDAGGQGQQNNALSEEALEMKELAQRNLLVPAQENMNVTSQSMGEQPSARRSDHMLLDHLNAVARATAGPSEIHIADMVALFYSLWSRGPEEREPTTGRSMDFQPVLARIAAQLVPDIEGIARLNAVLPFLEPDADKQVYAVRTMLARLALLNGPDATGLRADAKTALSLILIELTGQGPDQPADLAVPAQKVPQAPDEQVLRAYRSDYATNASARPDEEVLHVTENAGLVMLHPYFNLLFERLKIEHDGQVLHPDHLPRALGALHFLAGAAPLNDPLLCVLLGLDTMYPLPDAEPPDDDAEVLMDGLLRSVIERWGKLGATSPDALRETFIQRTGSLRFDETAAWLRVAPGPFDMLLDSLPWRLSPVAMRWMPLPCFVSWREDENA